METYYSKKEFNDMKKALEKKILLLEKRNQRLMEKIKEQQTFIDLMTK